MSAPSTLLSSSLIPPLASSILPQSPSPLLSGLSPASSPLQHSPSTPCDLPLPLPILLYFHYPTTHLFQFLYLFPPNLSINLPIFTIFFLIILQEPFILLHLFLHILYLLFFPLLPFFLLPFFLLYTHPPFKNPPLLSTQHLPLPLPQTYPSFPSTSPPHSSSHSNLASSSSLHHSSTELKILSFNARSLFPKLDDLKLLCLSHSPDIICITETWLSPVILNSEINFPGYALLRLDRDRHGGGVAMMISSSLSPSLVSLPSNSTELLLSSITHRKHRLFIGTFYRPPSSNTAIASLSSVLSNISSSILSNLILVGDFNVNYTSSFPIVLLFLHFFSLLTPSFLYLNPIPLSVVPFLISAKLLILFLTYLSLISWHLLISPLLFPTGFTPTFSTAPNV